MHIINEYVRDEKIPLERNVVCIYIGMQCLFGNGISIMNFLLCWKIIRH